MDSALWPIFASANMKAGGSVIEDCAQKLVSSTIKDVRCLSHPDHKKKIGVGAGVFIMLWTSPYLDLPRSERIL